MVVPSPSLPHVPVPRPLQSFMPHVQTVPSVLSAMDDRAPPHSEMTPVDELAVTAGEDAATLAILTSRVTRRPSERVKRAMIFMRIL